MARDTLLEDISGKKMPAIDVFSKTLSYLRKDLLETIRTAKIGVEETDISFVLTVPAIWNDAAKQFMREAAIKVNITQ